MKRATMLNRWLAILPVVCFMGAGEAVSSTTTLELVDQAATLRINPETQAGVFDWLVDGQDYLGKQWVWYRAGSMTQEESIDTLQLVGSSPGLAASGSLLYTNAGLGFDLKLESTLVGTGPGNGQSDVDETISLKNYSTAPLSISLFLFVDFNLSPSGDVVENVLWRNQGSFTGYSLVEQSGGGISQSTIFSKRPTRAEVGDATSILGQLTDAFPTTLSSTGSTLGPVGPGDMAYALQWDFSLAPEASVAIGLDKLIVVPEPTVGGLVLMGLAGLVAVRVFRSREACPARG